MENAFFIFTKNGTSIELERFHICTWEFNNNSSLVEFGFEISKESIKENQISLSLYIPWITKYCKIKDLYDNLSDTKNSRFIFNDYLTGTTSLDGGINKFGVIHRFAGRNELCILPIAFDEITNLITINVNIKPYQEYESDNKPNIYFRFAIKPNLPFISIRKNGINKSTIIYDIKVNEKRNIPDDQLTFFSDKVFCKIKRCFCFNIIPNKYDLVFLDNSLKNIRTLEYDSFNKYLADERVKKDDLLVVFNKKENAESFSFFSIYCKERIGPGQVAFAILINFFSGILLSFSSCRKSIQGIKFPNFLWHLPSEIYLSLGIIGFTLIYFIWPSIINNLRKS